MGYRSEVSVVMTRSGFASMMKEIPNELSSLALQASRFESLEDSTLLYWESIKWYDNNTPIRQFMNVLSTLEDSDYYFIELGEDTDDNKERGMFWDNPFSTSLVRHIGIDATGKPVQLAAFM